MKMRLCGRMILETSMGEENRQRVKFWKDKLCGDTPLSHYFPSLFATTSSKEDWVQGVWRETGGGGFRIPFFRDANDWEVGEVVRLFS